MVVTLEKLNELIHYYEISNQFLNEVEKNSIDNATQEDLEKLRTTKDLFSNTSIALNQLKNLLINTTTNN